MKSVEKEVEDLKEFIKGEGAVVTAITLARKLDVPIHKAIKLMEKLWEKRDKVAGLWAVYAVNGVKQHPNMPDEKIESCVLSKWNELQQVERQFESVTSKTLYSLQCIPLDSIDDIFRQEMQILPGFYDTDAKRASIQCEEVDKLRNESEGLQKHKARPAAIAATHRTVSPDHTISHANPKKAIIQAKQPDLAKLFAKAAAKEKTPRSSPKKLPESPFSPLKTPKKEVEESPTTVEIKQEVAEIEEEDEDSPLKNNLRRKRKIMIDDDEEDWEDSGSMKRSEGKGSSSGKKKGKAGGKEQKEKENTQDGGKKKINARRKIAIEEDLFDADDDDTGRAAEAEVAKKKGTKGGKTAKNVTPPTRTSPRKRKLFPSVSEENAGQSKKTITVTEEFVDEDGFTVTKQVKKEVDLTEEEKQQEQARRAKRSTNDDTSSVSSRSTTSSKGSKKVPAGQSTISSFFTKK